MEDEEGEGFVAGRVGRSSNYTMEDVILLCNTWKVVSTLCLAIRVVREEKKASGATTTKVSDPLIEEGACRGSALHRLPPR
jgi:hypothetical protein